MLHLRKLRHLAILGLLCLLFTACEEYEQQLYFDLNEPFPEGLHHETTMPLDSLETEDGGGVDDPIVF